MKNRSWLTLVFLLIYFAVQAQTTITGVVTDLANNPIPYATVYLSKTTFGVLTNGQGAYSLTVSQDGAYELICSCLGYETYSEIIKADGTTKKIDIKLSELKVLINEVTVKGKDKNRWQNYEQFKKCFIGKTSNAPFCSIKNQEDLIVYRNSEDSILIAYSIKPLMIKNSSFGYMIVYDLKNFRYNLQTKHLRFSGDYYFQDISNPKKANSAISRNRLISYSGSRMHFLRALFADSLSQENFTIFNSKLDSTGENWILSDTIPENDLRLALTPDSMTLYHPNPVFINYSDNHPVYFPLPLIYRQGKNISTMTFSDSLQVYKNGYYPDGYDLTWGGSMANDRVAELLPFDYTPKAKGEFVKKSNK